MVMVQTLQELRSVICILAGDMFAGIGRVCLQPRCVCKPVLGDLRHMTEVNGGAVATVPVVPPTHALLQTQWQ